MKEIQILLVEDNPGDILLTREALKNSKILNVVNVAKDGEVALDMLFKTNGYENFELPDLILLDINLPKIDGSEVLVTIKNDKHLKVIPVIMLTTSDSDIDVYRSYSNYANSYIVKPVDMDKFFTVITSIENFWLTVVRLPSKPSGL
ncbi:MAG: response regulator [Chitinophagaceae bacterium]